MNKLKNENVGIKDVQTFFYFMKENIDEYKADNLNVRKALNAIIFSYHIFDWVKQTNKNFKIDEDYEENHKILGDLSNGTKHFSKKTAIKKNNGSFSRAFSRAFDISYLFITIEGKKYYIDDIIDKAVEYWDNKINRNI